MRKLATIRKIKDLVPIKDADRIELAKVDGWNVVVQKGLHVVGDLVVYCEIDSFLPICDEFEFLRPSSFKKDSLGVEGFKLRTMKMQKTISQGLILPIRDLPYDLSTFQIGEDVSNILGIIKWEPPIPAEIGGDVKGGFPGFIKKTEEIRAQNLDEADLPGLYYVTEKMDGTSFTAYMNDGEFGICGRNWEFYFDVKNTHCRITQELDMESKLDELGRNLAIQGELVGEGIQKNLYRLKGQKVLVFNIFDIDAYKYLEQSEVDQICKDLGFDRVPIIDTNLVIGEVNHDELLKMSEGKSALSDSTREGLVLRAIGRDFSFKLISNKFLIKHE